MMSAWQASRLLASVGGGGVYRKCPPSMEKGAACEEKVLVKEPHLVSPILSGMQAVMTRGTGNGLTMKPGLPPDLRVYGKTGTADAIGIEEERPWGVAVGTYGRPHSWFVALAEPANVAECNPTAPKRLGVALVIPRSGRGALYAGPAAAEVLNAMYKLELFGKLDANGRLVGVHAPSPSPAPPPASSSSPAAPSPRPSRAPSPTSTAPDAAR
jgi:cell division protein FtsI/penicillin-binding protein 2